MRNVLVSRQPLYAIPEWTARHAPELFDLFQRDVNGDSFVTAIDALLVINYLNEQSAAGGESGEGELPPVPSELTVPSDIDDEIVTLLAQQLTARRRTKAWAAGAR